MTVPPSSSSLQSRAIRVFVSSTFRDLHDEREELVKHVFPQLRKLCRERGATWGEVDLRWGVTEEQAERGDVLPICLSEIDQCRPFFIGILGERYGWVPGPENISARVRDAYPWLEQHVDDSLTELEMWYGALAHHPMGTYAYFYLRDPSYAARLPSGSNPEDFRPDNATERAKLQDLRERIRRSGYPVRDGYRDPTDLGKQVLADFTKVVESLFPPNTFADPLDKEASEHEAFARSRLGAYVGRPEYVRELTAFANQSTGHRGLIVTGEPGSGKSALLANWMIDFRRLHRNQYVFYHAFGATPESGDGPAMLRRLLSELTRRLQVRVEIPEDTDGLQHAFADSLAQAASRDKIVLVLDALNQLEEQDRFSDLAWLPEVIPSKIRVIAAALPGPTLREMIRRGWKTLRVHPLSLDERHRVIVETLRTAGKALDNYRHQRILQAPMSANPLFLRALLEELRIFGLHERLDERIDHYLSAVSLDELFSRILQRYEEDYERERPGLVRDAMSMIHESSIGLTEAELLELLGSMTTNEPLPQAYWSPLYLAAEQELMNRNGRITFLHDYMRRAVQTRYLGDTPFRHATRRRLADYFAHRQGDPRHLRA
jgi:nephrocystin-3